MDKIAKIKELTSELLQYCHEYYVLDNPSIPDTLYDKKYDELLQLETETNFWLANSPTRKVQGEVLPYLEKVKHSVPMLSADKSTDFRDVEKFIHNRPVIASYKLDGSTVVLKYNQGHLVQALSRGSGVEGENITHTAKMIKNLPQTIPSKEYIEIRGEAVIPWKYYNDMNKDGTMGHPRNVASGALRQLDANEAAKRNIYFYAFTLVNWKELGLDTKHRTLLFLKENGFDVVPHILATTNIQAKEAVATLDRETYELPTDGWCFEFNDLSYGESLGSTHHHDRRLYALKPSIEEYETRFRGIEYNTCRTGVVSMTALFDPVEVGNTMVSRATLHNIDFFNGLELGENDLITITKFNEIIPGIVDNQTRSGTYKLIDICPSCGTKLEIKNTGTANVLYCSNNNCPSKTLAKFVHFCSKNAIDIANCSEATLELLISKGYIKTFLDIYSLSEHKDKLIQLPGFGRKSVENLLLSIENSRKVKLSNYIVALGIPGVGVAAAKVIADYFNQDYYAFEEAMRDDFDWTVLPDFGQKTSDAINKWWDKQKEDIFFLPTEFEFEAAPEASTDNSLADITFCITGSFTQSRDALKAQLEARGAKFVSSISKNIDILFAGEKAGSKLKKAQELGIKVVDEAGLFEMLK